MTICLYLRRSSPVLHVMLFKMIVQEDSIPEPQHATPTKVRCVGLGEAAQAPAFSTLVIRRPVFVPLCLENARYMVNFSEYFLVRFNLSLIVSISNRILVLKFIANFKQRLRQYLTIWRGLRMPCIFESSLHTPGNFS